ncbi:hypothetical protein Cpin_5412 [Chitinophaga pinensis DSM 2588]|uniref:DUF1990 domain-containing protein n=2 Tax=Chitinophaga pinensis TaxID=79329 RepID=A0A979GY21_CHIPD|nr:hypothetical protein Cpin_5412 [Chitinophaga pinensis DSM 2588]
MHVSCRRENVYVALNAQLPHSATDLFEMKLYLIDQAKNFPQHLRFLKGEKVMPYNKDQLIEKISFVELNTRKSIEDINVNTLFDYDIFPGHIMHHYTQWKEENRSMQVGDTIVQQVYVPPVKSFSQKIIFGVRVSEIIDQQGKKGFSYETLKGHVEKGISTFTVEQGDQQQLIFKIHTYSIPGNMMARILSPVFSIPYQTFCTRSALAHVKGNIERKLPSLLPTEWHR